MTERSPLDQIIEMLAQQERDDADAGVQRTGRKRWILPAVVTVATVAALAKPVMTIVGAFAGGGGDSGDSDDAYVSTCIECGETYDEADLDEGRRCEECAEDYPGYCCGIMYEDGDTVCGSCGEPL